MLVPSCSEKAAGAGGPPTSPFFIAGSSPLWGSGHRNSCSETAAEESGLQTSSPFFVAGSSPFWGSGHRPPCGGVREPLRMSGNLRDGTPLDVPTDALTRLHPVTSRPSSLPTPQLDLSAPPALEDWLYLLYAPQPPEPAPSPSLPRSGGTTFLQMSGLPSP
ncbi:UNVERIFIED_CONTAM: hypothetical protein FKN15_056589 [Acipenser sinensis]